MWAIVTINDFSRWQPNHENPQKRGPELYIFSTIFLVVATICVGVRLWTRAFVRRWVGLDDYLVIVGYGFSVAVTVFAAIGFHRYGWNLHTYDLPSRLYSPSAKMLYFSRIAWGLGATTTRLSVLCLYYRLLTAARAPKAFFWANHVITALTVSTWLIYLFWNIFICQPISAYWSWPNRPGDRCGNDGRVLLAMAIANTFQELVTATMPVAGVFILRVRKEQRWSVISVLSLGYTVVVAGVFRTYYIVRIIQVGDPTWYASPHWLFSEAENYLALICACAPAMRPILGRLDKRIKGLPPVHSAPPPRTWLGSLAVRHSAGELETSSDSSIDLDGLHTPYDWITAMSRTIDLEGIAVDGLGYKVNITGPNTVGRRRGGRDHLISQVTRQRLPRDHQSLREEASFGPTIITTKTDITIEEEHVRAHSSTIPWGHMSSIHDLELASDSKPGQPRTFRQSRVTMSDLEEGPKSAKGTQQSSFHDNSWIDDNESIYALPIMPTSSIQEPKRKR